MSQIAPQQTVGDRFVACGGPGCSARAEIPDPVFSHDHPVFSHDDGYEARVCSNAARLNGWVGIIQLGTRGLINPSNPVHTRNLCPSCFAGVVKFLDSGAAA